MKLDTFLVLSLDHDNDTQMIVADYIPARDEKSAANIARCLGREVDWVLDADMLEVILARVKDAEEVKVHKADLRGLAGLDEHN